MQIAPDGQVRAVVTATATGQIKENVSGSLVYKLQGDETKTVPLVVEPKTGVLVAAGPKLEADLTEVNYTVQVSGSRGIQIRQCCAPWRKRLESRRCAREQSRSRFERQRRGQQQRRQTLNTLRAQALHSNVARTKPNLLLSSGVVNFSKIRGLPSSVERFPIRVCSVTK